MNITEYPDNYSVHYELAKYFMNTTDRKQEAIELLKKAIDISINKNAIKEMKKKLRNWENANN